LTIVILPKKGEAVRLVPRADMIELDGFLINSAHCLLLRRKPPITPCDLRVVGDDEVNPFFQEHFSVSIRDARVGDESTDPGKIRTSSLPAFIIAWSILMKRMSEFVTPPLVNPLGARENLRNIRFIQATIVAGVRLWAASPDMIVTHPL
jgi:hypothetical protein